MYIYAFETRQLEEQANGAYTHTHVYLEEEETQTSIRNRKKESSLLSFFFVHRQPATAGAALER